MNLTRELTLGCVSSREFFQERLTYSGVDYSELLVPQIALGPFLRRDQAPFCLLSVILAHVMDVNPV